MYDMILHVGDFAYDMDTVSDFMKKLKYKEYILELYVLTTFPTIYYSFIHYQDNAHVGDEFMRQIESIAAYTPYMTCPGNHESA